MYIFYFIFTSLYSITNVYMIGDDVKTGLDPQILVFLTTYVVNKIL